MALATDDSGFFDGAGFALLAAGLYGGIGAGIGVGIDALVRGRPVIYDHPAPAQTAMVLVPVVRIGRGTIRAGAMLALRF